MPCDWGSGDAIGVFIVDDREGGAWGSPASEVSDSVVEKDAFNAGGYIVCALPGERSMREVSKVMLTEVGCVILAVLHVNVQIFKGRRSKDMQAEKRCWTMTSQA